MDEKCSKIRSKLQQCGFDANEEVNGPFAWEMTKDYDLFRICISRIASRFSVEILGTRTIPQEFLSVKNYISPEYCIIQMYEAICELERVKYLNVTELRDIKLSLQRDICLLMGDSAE